MFFLKKKKTENNRKQKMRIAATVGILTVVLGTGNVLPVQAADFKHVHTETCYTQKMAACTASHSQSTRTETTTRHCSNCNAQTPQTLTVNWDRCYQTGQYFEMGGRGVCNKCGATTSTWGTSGRYYHEMLQKVVTCGKSEALGGQLWIRNTTPEWTAEEVVLEAGVTLLDDDFSMAAEPFSWDGQASWGIENLQKVTENGSYSVYAQSSDGSVVQETLEVKNIDRTPPMLLKVERSEEEWTNQDVVLTFLAEDRQPDGTDGCGLAGRPYSYDGGETFTDETVLKVSENGSYDVVLVDNLGNKAVASVEVSNIDKEAPVITGIVQTEEGWQPESVTMKVQAEDAETGSGLHAQSYSLDGKNWQESAEFLFAENGTYEAFVRDFTGNEMRREFTVDKIDRTAPVITELEISPDKIWDDKVLVTVHAKDIQPDETEGCGLHAEAYSLDGGETWQAADSFYVEKGQSYDIRVRDALLHQSKEYAVTREHFPYPPKEDTAKDSEPTPQMPPKEATEEELVKEEVPEPVQKEKKTDKTDKEGVVTQERCEPERQEEEIKAEEPEIKRVTEERPEKLSDQILPVEALKCPWYKTTAGTAVLIGTGTAVTLGSVFLIAFLYWHSIPVYCLEKKGKEKKLGRVFLHRSPGGYRVRFPEFMVQEAGTAHYRMKVSLFLLKRLENARLLIESEGKSIEVVIQETIDFVL